MIEIEAVLNSRPLTYVFTEDLDKPLTPSHLLFGYRALSLPDLPLHNDPDYHESAKNLSRKMKHLLKTSEKFWKRWKKEDLLELYEYHRTFQANKGAKDEPQEEQIVTVYDEGQPRRLWRVGRIEGLIQAPDGRVRSAQLHVQSKTGQFTVLKRPIQCLYPLETSCQADLSNSPSQKSVEDSETPFTSQSENQEAHQGRARRSAATEARNRILGIMTY